MTEKEKDELNNKDNPTENKNLQPFPPYMNPMNMNNMMYDPMNPMNSMYQMNQMNLMNPWYIHNMNPMYNIGSMGELLPRGNKIQYTQKPEYNENEVIITFDATTGLKVIIPISKEKTLNELLTKYMEKANLPLNMIGDKIIFLYNGGKIEPSNEKIRTLIKGKWVKITVFDNDNVIGA